MAEREIAGLHVNESGSGNPVLLIHAFPIDSGLYAFQLQASFEGFRLIAPDLPGFGRSPLREVGSIDDYADALLAVLDAEGIDRFVCGGTSMGGYIAFALWRKVPERIAGVILANTRPGPDGEDAKKGREDNARKAEEEGSQVIVEALLPKLLTAKTINHQPEIAERVRRMGSEADGRALAAALRAMAGRPDSTALLGSMNIPALVVSGSEDAIIPAAEAEAMHDALPSSQLEIMPGAGHLTPLEAADDFNRTLRAFLEDVEL